MPKERVAKKSRVHKEIQKEGINFNKEFGQHILKNPLIITSMVEKVFRFAFFSLLLHEFISELGCRTTHRCCRRNRSWYR